MILALLAWLLVAALSAHGQSITTDETEEFSGQRQIISEGVQMTHDSEHEAYVRSLYGQEQYVLLIDVYADSWQHLGASGVDLVAYADDEPTRLRAPMMRVTSDVRSGGSVYERHGILLEDSEWQTLMTADEVRMRVSGVVYTLPPNAIEEMRLVAQRVGQ